MGGRVLSANHYKNCEIMNRTTFDDVVHFLTQKLDDQKLTYTIVNNVTEQSLFKEVNVIIDIDMLSHSFFDITPYARNANVHTFILNHKYKVNFIKLDKEHHDIAKFYYSYNDFGFILSTLLSYRSNYVLKETGLYYKYQEGKKPHLIFLTNKLDDILSIVQLDIETYNKGFNTLDELFQYVSLCPIFNSSIFQIDNLKRLDKCHYRISKTYSKFIKWLSKNEIDAKSYGKLIPAYVKFKDIVELEINSINENTKFAIEFKSKFNGSIVRSLTGLQDKDLAQFISLLKKKYSSEQLMVNLKDIINIERKYDGY